MKALRVYYVGALVWLLFGLSITLISCSDKKTATNNQCVNGMKQINGICTWDPTNPPTGGGGGGTGIPGGFGFIPNGDISNSSKFRDFNYRLFNTYSYCMGNIQFNCSDIQIKLQKINSTEYFVYISSLSLGFPNTVGQTPMTVQLRATKFSYDGQAQVIFEIYYNNPTRYILAELVMHQGLSSTSSYYTLNFKDNSSYTTMADGQMKKGYDYY